MNDVAHDLIELNCGPVVPIMSKAPRAVLVAGPGKKYVSGDFSNVEGRVNAWFAGESWKLDAFRAYDAGTGPDLYKLAVARSLNIPVETVTKIQRQLLGKPQELACGFQGAVGAFLRFVIDISAVTRAVMDSAFGSAPWQKAEKQYETNSARYGLSRDQWLALRTLTNMFRDANPCITQSWWDLQDAAIEAVDATGSIVPVLNGKIKYMSAEGFLWCQLPSGKLLAYCKPRLVQMTDEYLVDAEGEIYPVDEFLPDEIEAKGLTLKSGKTRTQVCFDGQNQKTKAWGWQFMYGGLQCNNIVQGTARELLREAMPRVEAAGYPIVLHIHDELISEVAQEFGSPKEYESLMSVLPPWAEGLPLVASAWEDVRYVK